MNENTKRGPYRSNGHERTDEEEDQQVLRRKGRRARKKLDIVLGKTFTPRFLDDADQRLRVVRSIRRKVELLMRDAGGNESMQRAMLVKHATFLHVLLETQETELAESGSIDLGSFVQAINSLVGLLRMLGLEKRIKKAGGLASYLEAKEAE